LAFVEAGLVVVCAAVALASGVVHAAASPDTGHCAPAATAASTPTARTGILMNVSFIWVAVLSPKIGERGEGAEIADARSESQIRHRGRRQRGFGIGELK